MLRFYARPGHTCPVPGGSQFAGQFANYINRTTEVDADGIHHPAVADAAEFDEKSQVARELLRLMRIEGADYPLLPADEATARICGVPFQSVELRDGEWLPVAAPPSKADQ